MTYPTLPPIARRQMRKPRRKADRSNLQLGRSARSLHGTFEEVVSGKGGEPTPTAMFGCAMAMLGSRPKQDEAIACLALMDSYMRGGVPVAVLQKQGVALIDMLSRVMVEYGTDAVIGKKAMGCARTLLVARARAGLPAAATIKLLQRVEPSKFAEAAMIPFVNCFRAVHSAHFHNDADAHVARLPSVVQTLLGYMVETTEAIANTSADCLVWLLSHTVPSPYFTAMAPGVSGSLECLQQAWGLEQQDNLDHLAGFWLVVFEKLGHRAHPDLAPVLRKLIELLETDDFHYRSACERAIAGYIRSVGAAGFIQDLPFQFQYNSLSPDKPYVIKLLRCHVQSKAQQSIGATTTASEYLLRAENLWHLLPGFCTFPNVNSVPGNAHLDFSKPVFQILGKEMVQLFDTHPSLTSTICHCFRLLVELHVYLVSIPEDNQASTKPVNSANTGADDNADMDQDDKQNDEEDQAVQEDNYSKHVLPKLCNVCERVPQEERGYVFDAIESYAKISDPSVVNGVFKTAMAKFLDDADKITKQKRHMMLDLVGILGPTMDDTGMSLLYRAASPVLTDNTDPLLQKKAYKAVHRLLKTCDPALKQSKANALELTSNCCNIFMAFQDQCSTTARPNRLKCLFALLDWLSRSAVDANQQRVVNFFVEAVSCVKDTGVNTRMRALDIIELVCDACYEQKHSVDSMVLVILSQMVSTQGPAAQRTSCAVTALAHMAVCHPANISGELLRNAFLAAFSVLLAKSPEIKNSVFGFAKIVLKLARRHENIRLDKIEGLMPREHKRYVQYVEKQRLKAQSLKTKDKAKDKELGSSNKELFQEVFFGNEHKKVPVISDKFVGSKFRGLALQESGDAPLDLLDPNLMRRFVGVSGGNNSAVGSAKTHLFQDDDDDDGFALDVQDGKIVVSAVQDASGGVFSEKAKSARVDANDLIGLARGNAGLKRGQADSEDDDEDTRIGHDHLYDDDDRPPAKRTFVKVKGRKVEKANDPHVAAVQEKYSHLTAPDRRAWLEKQINWGEQYASKRAGGDVVKADAPEPYSYIPLHAAFTNKRNRHASVKRFDKLAKMTNESKARTKSARSGKKGDKGTLSP
eukprot:gene5321-950_t